MSISITLFKTGLSITSESHTHFIKFDDLSISKLSDESVDIEISPPLGTNIQGFGIIGLVEIGPGYLVLIDEQEHVFQYEDIDIWKILKTVVIPMRYDLCKSIFGIDETSTTGSDEISDTSSSENKKNIVNQMKKNKDILFSKLGIYADDLKSSASLSISKKPAQPRFSDDFENSQNGSTIASESSSATDLNEEGSSSIRMKRSITLRRPTVSATNTTTNEVKYDDISKAMLNKFEKQLKTFFGSKGFYYSDQIDLSQRIAFQEGKIINKSASEEGGGQSGKAFWYNRHICKKFINNKQLSEVPYKKIIQGFIKSIDINLEIKHTSSMKDSQILLISKRSIKRAGLRYLRRGIDDSSNVANFVHTSQIFIMKDYELLRETPLGLFCKFDIIRGSIPLYFNQDPSNLKPVPYLTKALNSDDTQNAFKSHFERLAESYGDVSCISLVERSKRESEIGDAFVKMCEENKVNISWFDFHKVCAGMKFNNVSKILDSTFNPSNGTVEQKLLQNGYFDSLNQHHQTGVFRINCIDCLDRTNLVSKFLAEYLLMSVMFIKYNLSPTDLTSFQTDFNNLWADNGDSISRQYASTNALKGDYTRTSKRNYKGLVQDAWLSMSRYYSGYVSDYFKQCVIEYLVGVKGKDVFLEFERSFNVKDSGVENGLEETKRRANITEALKLNDSGISHCVLVGLWHGFESSMKLNELRLVSNDNTNLHGDVWIVLTNRAIHFITFDKDDEIEDLVKLDNNDIQVLQYGIYFKNGGAGFHNDSLTKKPERNIGLKFILNDIQKPNGSEVFDENQSKDFLAVKFPHDMEYSTIKHIINLISKTLTSSCLLEAQDILTLKDAAKLNTFNDFVDGIEYKFKKLIWG